jgi:hypothetical protein
MAKTGAERQRESMARLRANAASAARLATELEAAHAAITELEAELADRGIPKCKTHGVEYSCGLCHRGSEWD